MAFGSIIGRIICLAALLLAPVAGARAEELPVSELAKPGADRMLPMAAPEQPIWRGTVTPASRCV